MPRPGGIIVCGKRYVVDHEVVTYDDTGGYSAYLPHRSDDITQAFASDPAPGLQNRTTRFRRRRLMGNSHSLSRLRKIVRQIVVHLDGCRDARMCYHVLHNQRGLSVHFMVDNDGTIYQTLDLEHCAFHAGGVNEISIGIELQNRGDAARSPNYYKKERPTVTCRVHGHQFLCYDFTPAQYVAMQRLTHALTRILDVPLVSPQDSAKRHMWTKLESPRSFRGFLGHYHVSTNKWDPGPFDFKRVFREVGSAMSFPLSAPPARDRAPRLTAGTAASDAAQLARVRQQASRYFESSEQDVSAYFPLGPLGQSRLWHGGVHLAWPLGTKVRAVLRGRLVAARVGPPCGIGSCNFALVEHRLTIGRAQLHFFSLYYHLGWSTEDAASEGAVPWLLESRKAAWRSQLDGGQVVLLRRNVEAGEVIGQVGEAGPAGHRESQIHFAIFAPSELTARVDPGAWRVIDGTGNRLCQDSALLRKIDRPVGGQRPDGMLSRRELRNFFRLNPGREPLRKTALRYKAEWVKDGWEDLDKAPDFAQLPAGRRRRMFRQQIKPTLWWSAAVSAHTGLPSDGIVYAYHPIGFLRWFAEVSRKQANLRAIGIEGADRWEGKAAPRHITVDAESGDAMTDSEDFYSGERGKKLTLADLVAGYPSDKGD
ncbi:MAG: N-acetylmuramoyl-L-alanine amidase [Myxococcales bacterium]|nr:N-acetylmuramoyl-L-alanine amidase [Myxococcales bacterium]